VTNLTRSISLLAVRSRFPVDVDFWLSATLLGAAWFYYPYCQVGPTLCVWRKLLGIACPSCGLTRGVCFLVHGQFAEAVRFNPLSLVVSGILLGNIFRGALRRVAIPWGEEPKGFKGKRPA